MFDTQTPIPSNSTMSAMDAIHQRRSVRQYTQQAIDPPTIHKLLDAAVLAPTAMHQEPWSFVVLQDKKLLERLADKCVEQVREAAKNGDTPMSKHKLHVVDAPDFRVFHGAGTLIMGVFPAGCHGVKGFQEKVVREVTWWSEGPLFGRSRTWRSCAKIAPTVHPS
jgi:hypothetical protein